MRIIYILRNNSNNCGYNVQKANKLFMKKFIQTSILIKTVTIFYTPRDISVI